MPLDLDAIEGLTLSDEQKAAILKQHDDDTVGLKKNRDELLEEKKLADKAKTDAEAAAEETRKEAELEAARKKGDVDAITKSFQEKLDAEKAKADKIVRDAAAKTLDSEAVKLANKLSDGDNVDLMTEFVKKRLKIDEDGKVKVTDSDGNLTISTTTDLVEEFKGDKRFASLVTASKASGGGADDGDDNKGGGRAGAKDWSKMSVKEKAAHIEAKKKA